MTKVISLAGETAVIHHFAKLGCGVFTSIGGKEGFDLVVSFENKLYRVEVKTTQTRNKYDTAWVFQIGKRRPNRTETVIKSFDGESCDILALYIEPLDRVVLLGSKLTNKYEFHLYDREL